MIQIKISKEERHRGQGSGENKHEIPFILTPSGVIQIVLYPPSVLPHTQNAEDKDTPALARLFLASLAASGSGTDAQVALVNEVKAALGRALAMAESTEKHAR